MSLAMRIAFGYGPSWCFNCAFCRDLVVLKEMWS